MRGSLFSRLITKKSLIKNPKREARNQKQTLSQIPNIKIRNRETFHSPPKVKIRILTLKASFATLKFLIILNLFRVSDFEFSIFHRVSVTVSDRTLRERSFQLTQDPVGFAQRKFDDLIRARLRIAVGIDAQLRRVARRPDVRDVAIVEIDAHAIEDIDARDIVEPERGREEAH